MGIKREGELESLLTHLSFPPLLTPHFLLLTKKCLTLDDLLTAYSNNPD
jgi:hypothetical protein